MSLLQASTSNFGKMLDICQLPITVATDNETTRIFAELDLLSLPVQVLSLQKQHMACLQTSQFFEKNRSSRGCCVSCPVSETPRSITSLSKIKKSTTHPHEDPNNDANNHGQHDERV